MPNKSNTFTPAQLRQPLQQQQLPPQQQPQQQQPQQQQQPIPPFPVKHQLPRVPSTYLSNVQLTTPPNGQVYSYPHQLLNPIHPSPPSSSTSHTASPSTTPPTHLPLPPHLLEQQSQQPKLNDKNDLYNNHRKSARRPSQPKQKSEPLSTAVQQLSVPERTLATSKASCLRKSHHKSSRGVNVGYLHLTNTTLHFQAHYFSVAPKDSYISLSLLSITLVRTSSYRRILPHALFVRSRGSPDYLFAFACARDQLTFRHHLELAIHDANELQTSLNNIDHDDEENGNGNSLLKSGHSGDKADTFKDSSATGSAKVADNTSTNSNAKRLFRLLTRQSRDSARPSSVDTNTTSTTDDRDSQARSLPPARSLSRHFPREQHYDDHDVPDVDNGQLDRKDNEKDDDNPKPSINSALPRSISHPGDSTSSLALVTDGHPTAGQKERDEKRLEGQTPKHINKSKTLKHSEDDNTTASDDEIAAETSINTKQNIRKGLKQVDMSTLHAAVGDGDPTDSEEMSAGKISYYTSAIASIAKNTLFGRKRTKTVTIVTPKSTKTTRRFEMDLNSPSLKSHIAHRRGSEALIYFISAAIFFFLVMGIIIIVNHLRVRLVMIDHQLAKHL